MSQSNEDNTIEYHNGDRYTGDKDSSGRPHGKGTYIHHNESDQIQQGKYEGEWKDGEKHGYGKHYYRNGDVYDGLWSKGKRHGQNGTYTYYNNDPDQYISASYTGEWKNDQKDGQGTMVFTNGDVYKGQWEKGSMNDLNGKSTYTYANKAEYFGAWKKGNKHGKGKLIYENGDIYEGDFKHGERHGKGIYRFQKDNIITEGTYEKDRRKDYKIIKEHSSVLPTTTTTTNQRSVENDEQSDE